MDFSFLITMWDNNVIRRILLIIFTIIAGIIVDRLIRQWIHKTYAQKHRKVLIDDTKLSFFKHATTVVVYTTVLIICISYIPSLRNVALSMFAGAGVLAIVIGFASQQAFSNIINGIFIVFSKPIKVGDVIKFGERLGVVEDITLRHTVIRNFENKRFVVPNSIMNNEIIENYHINEHKTCRYVNFGISYDSDIDKAMEIMRDEAMKHPLARDNRTDEEKENGDPQVPVRVLGFGDSSVNLRAWVWADSPADAYYAGCDLNKSIKERFDKEGIEIPFPYRTIVYKNKPES